LVRRTGMENRHILSTYAFPKRDRHYQIIFSS
jgi:hypothetical protein